MENHVKDIDHTNHTTVAMWRLWLKNLWFIFESTCKQSKKFMSYFFASFLL